ncbi:YdiU family protein [Legionella lytica]|uniref:Protein nucleotidyltransferase YdiU n=1 Tax=Legionella lytica TaxID=96232 RepID=A0ABY4Y959_9GAMM|nr:YdiU family protein [Legionella lytica]USQ14175.1 YdiU family protein [Legionella lytica]
MIPNITTTSYLQLPDNFYEKIIPTPIRNPSLVQFNHELAVALGGCHTVPYSKEEALAIYAGNWVPPQLQSIALAYSGHQFGHFVSVLGDGRAIMLGEIVANDGIRWDMQLKGSGRTRFSRNGDGRAPLSAVLREYIISEAMHGLTIPTTRCLAAIASDEKIYRQTGLVPAGVLTRIAASSLRVGSFEYAATQKDTHLLKCLADYALERHFPELLIQNAPYLELFKAIVERQARLMAEWMGVGFIHGVMNTDNMAISGETLDYGPCAFMDEFDFERVYSSIDTMGRYAFGQQPAMAHWNLTVLRFTMQPLFNEQEQRTLDDILHSFPARFHHYWSSKIRVKLGLQELNEQTVKLIELFFALLQQHNPDFTNTFRMLSQAIDSPEQRKNLIQTLGGQTQSEQWVNDWSNYVRQQAIDIKIIKDKMNQVNPAYIPRNHLVENAINHFIKEDDRSLLDTLLLVLKNPYQQQADTEHLQSLPQPEERVAQTFCGT